LGGIGAFSHLLSCNFSVIFEKGGHGSEFEPVKHLAVFYGGIPLELELGVDEKYLPIMLIDEGLR
jgi:hypothetical protein